MFNKILAVSILLLSFQSLATDGLSAAFKACVNSSVSDGTTGIKKVEIDGTDDSLVVITCKEDLARNLFQEVYRFSEESQKIWSRGDEVITREFGRRSQCNRRIRDAEGNETNYYWCNIEVDLSFAITKALNL